MIIKTYVSPNKAKNKKEVKKPAIVEEVKPVLNNETIQKKKNNKKPNPTPVVIEKVPEVVEEEIKIEEDKIDLSEWLKEEDIID